MMSAPGLTVTSPNQLPSPAARTRALADFITLTKPRVNLLVVMTAGIGFYLGATGIDPWRVFHASRDQCSIGTTTRSAPIFFSPLNSLASSPIVIP